MQLSQNSSDDVVLEAALATELAPFAGQRIGIAISGGSDSRALLQLVVSWARDNKCEIYGATVDHGLRPEAAAEAREVGDICAALGISHEVLRWENWDQRGNLQAEARRARYRLLAQWATRHALATVCLGHTADDVAETFLIRLGRRAGVDGLAQMQTRFSRNNTSFLRPMLNLRRADLRAYLERRKVGWIDDPSNADSRFERVRMRQALEYLEKFDLGVEKISQSAAHLKAASEALRHYAAQAAETVLSVDHCDVLLTRDAMRAAPQETQRRLLIAALAHVAPPEFAPRAKAIDNLLLALEHREATTLSGCKVSFKSNDIRISRELSAISDTRACFGEVKAEWDGRWQVEAALAQTYTLRALGADGLGQCPAWRETGRARMMLIASPSLWCGEELIAAPLANLGDLLQAKPLRGREELRSFILSH